MSLDQYNSLMSDLLRERCSLTKLREELEGRRGRLCWQCKGFGHLAQNCRNKKGGEEGTVVPQNKFEVLKSRVMQCGLEGRTIRRVGVIEVECFKCGEKGHKCKECPLWVKKKRAVYMARPQKAQQERKPVRPIREKAQEREKGLRRIEEDKVAHVAEPQKAQQG